MISKNILRILSLLQPITLLYARMVGRLKRSLRHLQVRVGEIWIEKPLN